MQEDMGVPASPSGHSDEPASSLAAIAGSVPNAVTVGEIKAVLREKLDLSPELLADMEDNLTAVAVAVLLVASSRPQGEGLARMVAYDEEMEALHPGWMTGEPSLNATYPWQVYPPSEPHGSYDIGGPPAKFGTGEGFACIATVFGGKVDADYIAALHNARLAQGIPLREDSEAG